LLAATPRLIPEPKRANRLVQSEPLSAPRLPAGCAFSNRCPHVEPVCNSTEPALENVLDHQVAWALATASLERSHRLTEAAPPQPCPKPERFSTLCG
jgi:ABC-type dipeptide/oligopeptide/nickel transport system ATPase component